MKYHFRSNDFFRGREKLIGILHVIEYSSFLPLQMRQFDLLLWVILALLDFSWKTFFWRSTSRMFVIVLVCLPHCSRDLHTYPLLFFNRKKSQCDLRKRGYFFSPLLLLLYRPFWHFWDCMFCLNRLQSMQSHRAVLCQGIISISVLF